ncbi:cytochrome ubiquinol oxidase subunit I [Streptomonospora wellingtoniae]|uniref:Cytochrome ubiquinol oxidase subunit I n=1 Tax=Streptomonospora wellingtoniae TaxID=3075544 RepID=A0ABU2L1P4_9ACTN|nr:cytochrome ubiquinol oxidase subunit I [Streptomonospora sp. DSM 45055]MDT0305183.1 cytochrome ubiquinol oxidase subunit I [Streptomonospora sp. DSM 45055]
MEALDLARLQFAVTSSLHFMFVVLTLGLAPLVAIMQTMHTVSGRGVHERMTRFWGQIYLINYALGILSGLVMEFQFGLSWKGLSHYAGDVFGAPLAMETMGAFFLESTFLGLWIFGWHILPKRIHLALIWLVALTAYISAFWIMAANSYLQNPVGSREEDGRLVLTDFSALLTNPHFLTSLPHVVGAGFMTVGFGVTGISAYHLFRRTRDRDLFLRSLRIGVVSAAAAGLTTFATGHLAPGYVEETQPDKFTGPPVEPTMNGMLLIGDLLTAFAVLVLLPMLVRDRLARARWLHPLLVALIPLPYAASVLGWVVRELGRQPWMVYGELTVADAVSPVPAETLALSLTAFTIVVGLLTVTDHVLIARSAARGPADVVLGAPAAGAEMPAPSPAPLAEPSEGDR